MVVAGIRGGNPQSYSQGKKVLTNALLGIIILFGAWIGIDTIMKGLGAYSYAQGAKFGPWHVIECQSPQLSRPEHLECVNEQCVLKDGLGNGDTCSKDNGSRSCIRHLACAKPPEPQVCTMVNEPGLDSCDPLNDRCKIVDIAGICTGTGAGVSCTDAGVDTFEPDPSANCSVSTVNRWQSSIDKFNNSFLHPSAGLEKMIKAIIAKESGGDITQVSPPDGDGKRAYGLMQLKVATVAVDKYAKKCGVNKNDIDGAWLTNPANADKSVCLGASYLLDTSGVPAGPIGPEALRVFAAHFNGGPEAVAPSVNCTTCEMNAKQNKNPTQRWECLWDDNAHNNCNALKQTGNYSNLRKNYVPFVLKCFNEF